MAVLCTVDSPGLTAPVHQQAGFFGQVQTCLVDTVIQLRGLARHRQATHETYVMASQHTRKIAGSEIRPACSSMSRPTRIKHPQLCLLSSLPSQRGHAPSRADRRQATSNQANLRATRAPKETALRCVAAGDFRVHRTPHIA